MGQTFLRLTGVLMIRLLLLAVPAVCTGIGSYWVATQRAERKSTQLQQALTAVTKINAANGRKIAELQEIAIQLQRVLIIQEELSKLNLDVDTNINISYLCSYEEIPDTSASRFAPYYMASTGG